MKKLILSLATVTLIIPSLTSCSQKVIANSSNDNSVSANTTSNDAVTTQDPNAPQPISTTTTIKPQGVQELNGNNDAKKVELNKQ